MNKSSWCAVCCEQYIVRFVRCPGGCVHWPSTFSCLQKTHCNRPYYHSQLKPPPPPEHKRPAPHFIHPTRYKQHEYETIKNILHNNEYDPHTLDTYIKTITTRLQTQQITHNPSQTQHEGETTQQKEKTIWYTFTYVWPEKKYITKPFKHTNVKIVFKTKNTLTNLLSHRTQHQSTPTNMTKFNKCGIYRLQCAVGNMRYVLHRTNRLFIPHALRGTISRLHI